VPRLAWLACALVPAAALRLWELTVRPFHHDEGVNGWFFLHLWNDGSYRYDPTNYHGPTLYFLSLPVVWLAGGPGDLVLRLVAVACSLSTVALLTTLRPLGRSGALAAALLTAVSPAAVYFGRDYIHESLFVLCQLGIVVAAERFGTSGRPGWAAAVGVAAGLYAATKETAFPLLAVMAVALLAAAPRERLRLLDIAIGLGAAAVVAAAMYTNGFTRPRAVFDPIAALPGWISRGTGGVEHAKPFWTYLEWLWRMEEGLLVLGAIGVVLGLRTRRPFDRFVAVWATGTLLFFSALSYKTPWLVVDLVLPLAVASGITVREAWRWAAEADRATARAKGLLAGGRARTGVGVALGLVALLGVVRARDAALVRYDDHVTVYPYAQTFRAYRGLLAAIDRATAGRDPNSVRIAVTAPEYWPLPWDLRRFKHAAWFGKPQPPLDHDIVIAPPDGPPPVRDPSAYDRAVYPLRPGVDLALYARRR
jgi:uncharacterized protein (TIGR03663 family)